MKIAPAVLLLVFLLTGFLSEAKSVPGIVYSKNDSMEVILKIPIVNLFNEPKIMALQNSIRYITKDGETKTAYPFNIKGFKFEYEGISYQLRSVQYENTSQFLLLKVDDYLSIFFLFEANYELSQATRDIPVIPSRYVMRKDNGTSVAPRLNRFAKDMKGYFDDCPELAAKIENKTLRFEDAFEISEYYSYDCE